MAWKWRRWRFEARNRPLRPFLYARWRFRRRSSPRPPRRSTANPPLSSIDGAKLPSCAKTPRQKHKSGHCDIRGVPLRLTFGQQRRSSRGHWQVFSRPLNGFRMTELPERNGRQMHQRSFVMCDTLTRPSDAGSMYFYFSELRNCWFGNVFCALSVSRASVNVYRSETALSVVTVAVPTGGCVDEHTKQDGEVCVHQNRSGVRWSLSPYAW